MTRFAPFLLAATSSLALALAACDDRGASRIDAPEPEPLSSVSTTADVPYAEAEELPYAEPAPVRRYEPQRGYEWAERAYGLQRAFYDTPPDYGFDYDGVEPLVWESADDWSMYAEPWDDGYRYYYYEPGAAYPYFVRDDEYGYGFDPTGVLIAVFDGDGRYLSQDVVYRVAPMAGRYYVRGRDLRNAGVRAHRVSVDQRVWTDVAPRISRGADPWMRAARNDRAWREWRVRDQDRELRRFEGEHRRREARREVAFQQRVQPGGYGLPALRHDRKDPRDAERFGARQQAVAQAQAERGRQQAQAQRREALAQVEHGRQQAQLERRQAQMQADRGRHEAQAQAQRRQAQAQAERGRQQAQLERRQAQMQADRGRQQAQAQAQQRQAQAERGRQQAEAQAQRRQAQMQAEHGRQQAQAQAQRRQAQAQAERGRQQAQAQARAAQQQARGRAQQQAQAAEQHAQAASARERAQAAARPHAANEQPRGKGHRKE